MKIFLYVLLFLSLSGCLSTQEAHSHYEQCESKTSSVTELIACGKKARKSHCEPLSCSKSGDRLVSMLDVLSGQVASGEITESQAKLKYYEIIENFERSGRRMSGGLSAVDKATLRQSRLDYLMEPFK